MARGRERQRELKRQRIRLQKRRTAARHARIAQKKKQT
jgi:hypothetical protein